MKKSYIQKMQGYNTTSYGHNWAFVSSVLTNITLFTLNKLCLLVTYILKPAASANQTASANRRIQNKRDVAKHAHEQH